MNLWNLPPRGTGARADPTYFFSFEVAGKQYYLDLKILRILMESVSQETNIKFTSRQLVPSLASEIIEFAEKLNLAGNQRKKLSLTNKDIEKSDLG